MYQIYFTLIKVQSEKNPPQIYLGPESYFNILPLVTGQLRAGTYYRTALQNISETGQMDHQQLASYNFENLWSTNNVGIMKEQDPSNTYNRVLLNGI